MWINDYDEPVTKGLEVLTARKVLKNLLKRNASRYGLKEKMPPSGILDGTTLRERRTVLGTDSSVLKASNTVLFTGQCLVKSEENLECPITLEDAIECERLKEIMEKKSLAGICFLPDSVYGQYLSLEKKQVPETTLQRATQAYDAFRRLMVPNLKIVRLSEVATITELSHELEKPEIKARLLSKIRRVYGGRPLKPGQRHPLQELLINYGLAELEVPRHCGYENKDIALFAEPDEICSLKAAEAIAVELGRTNQLALIGAIALPAIDYFENGEIRMYSAKRSSRLHLDESETAIRDKLATHPAWAITALALSPLTPTEMLEDLHSKPKLAVDTLMELIVRYKRLAREAL